MASMDFTPVTFSDSVYPHVTTYAHELALSVVFESGWQQFFARVAPSDTALLIPPRVWRYCPRNRQRQRSPPATTRITSSPRPFAEALNMHQPRGALECLPSRTAAKLPHKRLGL